MADTAMSRGKIKGAANLWPLGIRENQAVTVKSLQSHLTITHNSEL